MELTPFGREVRKLRIEFGLLLKDMADKLAVSPSWLSALETGRKNVPQGVVEKISKLFSLSKQQADALADAADRSRNEFSLKVGQDPLRRDVAASHSNCTGHCC